MKKSRLVLCLLLSITALFYAAPYLTFQGNDLQSIFSIAWLAFALAVISGNFIAISYGEKVNKNKTGALKEYKRAKQKVRQYS